MCIEIGGSPTGWEVVLSIQTPDRQAAVGQLCSLSLIWEQLNWLQLYREKGSMGSRLAWEAFVLITTCTWVFSHWAEPQLRPPKAEAVSSSQGDIHTNTVGQEALRPWSRHLVYCLSHRLNMSTLKMPPHSEACTWVLLEGWWVESLKEGTLNFL